MSSDYIELKGSYKPSRGERIKGINKGEPVSISVYLRPRTSLPDLTEAGQYKKFKTLLPRQFKSRHGALASDIEKVIKFAHLAGLSVSGTDAAQRTVELRGTIAHHEKAFQVEIENYASIDGQIFRGRSGPISIPKELANIVQGIFGLDNRPVATPKFQQFKPSLSRDLMSSYYPNQLAEIYGFPSSATGKKQCIGIIELGGGYREQDISNYFSSLGLKTPEVIAVSVDGGINDPGSPDSADGEVMLDIEVAGAVAPDATLAVYFAPNTDKGFLDAINAAIHDSKNKPDVLSISWGAPESDWTSQSLDAFNAAFQAASTMGISVCVAAGDRGSSDGVSDGLA